MSKIVETYRNGVLVSAATVEVPVEESNADDLRAKGLAYLALSSPTQAQTTKAVRALVMLALQKLDDLTGT
jgi:hypothetical protein